MNNKYMRTIITTEKILLKIGVEREVDWTLEDLSIYMKRQLKRKISVADKIGIIAMLTSSLFEIDDRGIITNVYVPSRTDAKVKEAKRIFNKKSPIKLLCTPDFDDYFKTGSNNPVSYKVRIA